MKDIIVITGGTSGYGKAAAKLFADKGHTVIITGRNEERLGSAAKETGAVPYRADATNPADWEALRKFVTENYGRIDLLLNNAGGGVSINETENQSIGDIDLAVKLNLTSVIYGCREFAPVFRSQKKGTIINVSSVCAKEAWPGWSVYAAAKWGVLGFSKGLATELTPDGIRVTCIVPGAGDTNFDKNANFTGRGAVPGLKANNVAEAILAVYELPGNVWVEEITVWGTDQVVIPL